MPKKLTRENAEKFFFSGIDGVRVGEMFTYKEDEFTWEEVKELALKQNIKVLKPQQEFIDMYGPCLGLAVLNIKKEASSLTSDEIMRLRKELNTCYQRIEDLETQSGIRGVERLERCEFCKQPLLPYQAKVSTDSGGSAHSDCALLEQIKELSSIIEKKEEAAAHWRDEATKLGEENHSLTTEKGEFRERLIALEPEVSNLKILLEEEKTGSIRFQKQAGIAEKRMAQSNREVESLSRLQKQTVAGVIRAQEIMRRAKKTLGDYAGGTFKAFPSVTMTGELREEFRGYVLPIYDEMTSYIESTKGLNEERGHN